MKRLLCGMFSSFLLLGTCVFPAAAEESSLFYSKTSTGEQYAALMPQWNGIVGSFATQTSEGVRIGTKENAGAMFSFPTYLDPQLTDWSAARYVEIDVINEKQFGTHLAVVIADNEDGDAVYGHEMFQLKANSPAYIEYADGTVYKRTSYGNGVFIPGSFKGKLYVPMDAQYLETLSWATKNGELNVKKISNISYMLNGADASLIIGNVYKTDKDPSPNAQTYPKGTVTLKPHPPVSVSTPSTVPTEGDSSISDPDDGVKDTTHHDEWGWIILACGAGGLAVVAGVAFYLVKKRKPADQNNPPEDRCP